MRTESSEDILTDQLRLSVRPGAPRSDLVVAEDVLATGPEGAAVSSFSYLVATGSYRSSGGGHMVSAHASLNLTTGVINGSVTTTNHLMLEGYCSGTLIIPRDRAGDPVRPNLPAQVRFRLGMRGPFSDPATRTDVLCFGIGADAARDVCSLDLIITDSADRLDRTLAAYDDLGETPNTWAPFISALEPFAVHVAGRGATTTA